MFDASPPHANHPLMQDRAFAAALRLCGEDPITLPSGHMLLNRRILGIPVLMLPRAAPPPDLIAQLKTLGLQRRPLILSPEHPCKTPRAINVANPRALYTIDLTPPREVRRAALHQNWRHQLGQAERSPLRILHRPLAPDHPLLILDAKQSRARRYQNWPTALTSAFAIAAPDQTHLFTALLRGHPVAHMLMLTHGNRATYHIGHTTDEGRSLHAHNLILWEAMNTFAARGLTTLDLGSETTPQIDRFKRRAGAQTLPTGGTWLRWTPLA
ncbi:GNAT family N-acetyltransferase [uncultured Sulfitobacter sp.]|uniref:GNAT family N-acetyltransferase n=1 Tax=uncultured Sulfitobacter sp. TaxID=191468 RepID=UPI00260C8374|nr:GNAT family N-acetyltransferase [uncultured Sulfitobacter sp.]